MLPIGMLVAAAPGPARIALRNATAAPLECQALAAHWHSLPPRLLSPGDVATLEFTRDGPAGALRVAPDGPAIERLFCGPPGRAWAERADIDLSRLQNGAAVVCHAGEAGLVCQSSTGKN